jgi:hypothetical protein
MPSGRVFETLCCSY